MSPLTYQHLPGPVGDCLRDASLSTTVKVRVSLTTSLVFTTGHVGLDLTSGSLVRESPEAAFQAIFDCLHAALKNAGVFGGLSQAYKLVSYIIRPEDERVLQGVFRRNFPGHSPTWATAVVKEIMPAGSGTRAEVAAEAAIFHE